MTSSCSPPFTWSDRQRRQHGTGKGTTPQNEKQVINPMNLLRETRMGEPGQSHHGRGADSAHPLAEYYHVAAEPEEEVLSPNGLIWTVETEKSSDPVGLITLNGDTVHRPSPHGYLPPTIGLPLYMISASVDSPDSSWLYDANASIRETGRCRTFLTLYLPNLSQRISQEH
jgi:hypothetical protein